MASVAWVALAAAVQLVWGLYPALLRFIQSRTTHPLSSLQLSFLINGLALAVSVLQALISGLIRRSPNQQCDAASISAQEGQRRPLLLDSAYDELSEGKEDVESLPLSTPRTPSAPRPPLLRPGSWTRKAALLSATTTALTTLMLSQIFALAFVEAYVSQIVFLLTPLLVSALALALFCTPLPHGFWTCLVLMLAGASMVAGGKAAAAGADSSTDTDEGAAMAATGQWALSWALPPLGLAGGLGGVSPDLVVGSGLSLLSAVSLASFMLVLQAAKGDVSNAQVLLTNFPVQAALCGALTWVLERPRFGVLAQLLPWEWGVVAGTALGINWLGNLLQQVTIARLGAPQVAAFLPLRLVGALGGSYVILAEQMDNSWEAGGAVLVLLTLSWYLWRQKRYAEAVASAALNAEAEVEAAGSSDCGSRW